MSPGSNCEYIHLENLIHILTSPNCINNFIDNDDIYISKEIVQTLLVCDNNNITEDLKSIIPDTLSAVRSCDICCTQLRNNQEVVLQYIKK